MGVDSLCLEVATEGACAGSKRSGGGHATVLGAIIDRPGVRVGRSQGLARGSLTPFFAIGGARQSESVESERFKNSVK